MNEATHWTSQQRFRSNNVYWVKWKNWLGKCNKHSKVGGTRCQHFPNQIVKYLCVGILCVSSGAMNAVFTRGSPELQCSLTYQLWRPFNVAFFLFLLNARWVNHRNKYCKLAEDERPYLGFWEFVVVYWGGRGMRIIQPMSSAPTQPLFQVPSQAFSPT